MGMPPNGLELSRPGEGAASILAPQCLEARQSIAPSPARLPRVRVLATSASPASILARRFRVGSSELLGSIRLCGGIHDSKFENMARSHR